MHGASTHKQEVPSKVYEASKEGNQAQTMCQKNPSRDKRSHLVCRHTIKPQRHPIKMLRSGRSISKISQKWSRGCWNNDA